MLSSSYSTKNSVRTSRSSFAMLLTPFSLKSGKLSEDLHPCDILAWHPTPIGEGEAINAKELEDIF